MRPTYFGLILSTFISSTSLLDAKVKNVILIIGDGMGPQQISLGQIYMQHSKKSPRPGGSLYFLSATNPPHVALSFTQPYDNLVVDSACSASHLSTGELSRPEMIGLNYDGNPVETILELAKSKGKATGLVSDTRITHATPASFGSHRAHRSMETLIAEDLYNNNIDVMFSGGYSYFLPQSVTDNTSDSYKKWRSRIPEEFSISSKRKDERDLLAEAEKRGDHLAFSLQDLEKINKGPVLGLFDKSAMPDAIVMEELIKLPQRKIPTLQELSMKAIEILEQNPKGFFLMIEAGQIDWAGHANDAGWMLKEVLRLDQATESVLSWAANRDDTVVVVTADHETGSFGFSYSQINQEPQKSLPGKAFGDAIKYEVDNNFGNYKQLDLLANQSESLESIAYDFEAKFPKLDRPKDLCKMVNRTNAFKLKDWECTQILKDMNRIKKGPKENLAHHLYHAFSLEDNLLANLIGRTISPQQNIVWGTGTHTSTPVQVLTWGPEEQKQKLSGILHHSQVGRILKEML